MSFGPFIQAACFCEKVLQETSGVISLIRIIDTLEHSFTGPNPPENMPPFQFRVYMVLMLKSGEAHGRWDLKIVPHLPTGETRQPLFFTIHFEGEEKGHNFILDFSFTAEYEGVYWFRVYLDDNELLTALPLRVKYNRLIMS